eukprot:403361422
MLSKPMKQQPEDLQIQVSQQKESILSTNNTLPDQQNTVKQNETKKNEKIEKTKKLENKQKLPDSLIIQLRKASKLVRIGEQITGDEKIKLLDTTQTNDQQFVKYICDRLKERNIQLYHKLVKLLGRDQSIVIFNKVAEIQSSSDGQRITIDYKRPGDNKHCKFEGYKQPGGVFIQLIKDEYPSEVWKKVLNDDKKWGKKSKEINKQMQKMALGFK